MNKDLIGSFAWGGGIVAVALGMTAARQLGYVDSDTVTRVVIGLNGLMIAWYGNRMPKTFVPSARARQARRVAAWSLVLSGLIYAGLWAFAPIPVAVIGGSGAVLAGIAVTLGYCLSLRNKAKAA
ncbi:ammonium transporter [Sphingomonas sp. JC676]|uniref:ammonium transporter n=1 Tax=Sphingomonas sp. JC676 TaxID=2768065 RepID=UPI0016586EE8|nr:ammonium transporter [Sphingomonas sp. JC676]MBC9032454.1 ammonium transporter [Sphingomonas sp. JC676]